MTIDRFHGPYRFLSNFWECEVYFEGTTYQSAEAAYQAAKTLNVNTRAVFALMPPWGAKKAGRKLQLRPDWEDVKLDVMDKILHEKFKHPELREKLLATGDAELIEGNHWGDIIWGVCNGEGANLLGCLLMALREELRG